MKQESLDFGRDTRASEALRHQLRALNDIVDAVGLGVAAGACGCRAQDLSDALGGRENRHMRIAWQNALLDLAACVPDLQHKLVKANIEWLGYAVAPAKPRDPKEELLLERAILQRIAPGVLDLLLAELRRSA